jgi:hypothetical protein
LALKKLYVEAVSTSSHPKTLELDIPEIEVLKRALRHYGNCVKEKRKVKVGTGGTELQSACVRKEMGVSENWGIPKFIDLSLYDIPICH